MKSYKIEATVVMEIEIDLMAPDEDTALELVGEADFSEVKGLFTEHGFLGVRVCEVTEQ